MPAPFVSRGHRRERDHHHELRQEQQRLGEDQPAGLYAGGLILTKALLFLPQFVVVVAFPSMSTAQNGAGR